MNNQTVVLDASVTAEIEDCLLAEHAFVEIALVHEKLVTFGIRFANYLAIGIDYGGATNERVSILDAALATATTHVLF